MSDIVILVAMALGFLVMTGSIVALHQSLAAERRGDRAASERLSVLFAAMFIGGAFVAVAPIAACTVLCQP